MAEKVSHYLKLSDMSVHGHVTAKGYENWIEVLSFSFGSSSVGTGLMPTGSAAGNASQKELHLVAPTGNGTVTVQFQEMLLSNRHVDSAILASVKEGVGESMRLEMKAVFCSGLQFNGSSEEVSLTQFSLVFQTVTVRSGIPNDVNKPSPQSHMMLHNAFLRGYKRIPPWRVK